MGGQVTVSYTEKDGKLTASSIAKAMMKGTDGEGRDEGDDRETGRAKEIVY